MCPRVFHNFPFRLHKRRPIKRALRAYLERDLPDRFWEGTGYVSPFSPPEAVAEPCFFELDKHQFLRAPGAAHLACPAGADRLILRAIIKSARKGANRLCTDPHKNTSTNQELQ
jgi:hypothetical protein